MRGEQARESIRGILENGGKLTRFYEFVINNPHLSFWNAVQVYAANPRVTVCKSFDDWHDQDNRRIKRGEHGIYTTMKIILYGNVTFLIYRKPTAAKNIAVLNIKCEKRRLPIVSTAKIYLQVSQTALKTLLRQPSADIVRNIIPTVITTRIMIMNILPV